MALKSDFVKSLEFVHPRELMQTLVGPRTWATVGGRIELVNEVRPVDLYCYFGGRFGPPNGLQNFWRKDDSDNLIHWDWTLKHETGFVSFLGMNFRTEVQLFGMSDVETSDKAALVAQLKADFSPHGRKMGVVRKHLEHWIEFVNPHQRIRRSVDRLLDELDTLGLQPDSERLDLPWQAANENILKARWQETAARFSKGFGLCFGIRSMLPILAESFVNLLLYVLLRPEIKKDDRLRDVALRQPIDVRVKSLSLNCVGFRQQIDYAVEPCRAFHTLINERNDLLHGNVVVDKLKFNEVFFNGKVPIFREYRSMWERSLEIEMNAVGLASLRQELAIVDGFIDYLKSCLEDDLRPLIEKLATAYELGLNTHTQGVGILFPGWLVDMRLATPEELEAAREKVSPDQGDRREPGESPDPTSRAS